MKETPGGKIRGKLAVNPYWGGVKRGKETYSLWPVDYWSFAPCFIIVSYFARQKEVLGIVYSLKVHAKAKKSSRLDLYIRTVVLPLRSQHPDSLISCKRYRELAWLS